MNNVDYNNARFGYKQQVEQSQKVTQPHSKVQNKVNTSDERQPRSI